MTLREVLIKQAAKRRVMQKLAEDENTGFRLPNLMPLLMFAPLLMSGSAVTSGGIGKLLARLAPTQNPEVLAKALGANKLLPTLIAGGGGQQALQYQIDKLMKFAPGKLNIGQAMQPWNWNKIRAAATFNKFKQYPELQAALARGATAPNVIADNRALFGQLGEMKNISGMPGQIKSLFGAGSNQATNVAQKIKNVLNQNQLTTMRGALGGKLNQNIQGIVNKAASEGRPLFSNELRTIQRSINDPTKYNALVIALRSMGLAQ